MDRVGMILCGGFGKRLRPLTDKKPKPLLEIREGLTILDKQLLDLKHAGVRDVILLVGYMHDKIEDRYGGSWSGLNILYSVEEKPLGTWGAVAKALREHKPKARLMIMNGDIVTDANLRWMMNNVSYPVTMFVVNMRSPYGIVDIDGEAVVGFREKPLLPYYINAGIYVVREDFDLLDFVGDELKPPSSLELDVFPRLARAGLLGSYVESDPYILWRSIDTIKDLEEIRKVFKNRVEKPWGYEKTISSTSDVVQKEVLIKNGYKIPLHCHLISEETIRVVKGKLEVRSKTGVLALLREGSAYTVKPNTPHSLLARENTIFIKLVKPNVSDEVLLEEYEW